MVDQSDNGPHYRADEVRQGEIELRRPWQRLVFVSGLVGIVLLVLILQLAPYL
jgi:hypothetical protein